jgi:hypothetical protein
MGSTLSTDELNGKFVNSIDYMKENGMYGACRENGVN